MADLLVTAPRVLVPDSSTCTSTAAAAGIDRAADDQEAVVAHARCTAVLHRGRWVV